MRPPSPSKPPNGETTAREPQRDWRAIDLRLQGREPLSSGGENRHLKPFNQDKEN